MEREHLYTLASGDEVYRYHEAVVVEFHGRRRVLSTGGCNGGQTEHLTHVFNHKSGYAYCKNPEDAPCTYEEYIVDFVENKLGLLRATSAGMATIVSMQNVCIETLTFRDITVTAIATASLEVNGGRVGDPADYYEEQSPSKPGTINIMLHVNANLSPGCLARALVTLTEAKTAAIQERMVGSLYSKGLATGSGSDSAIVVANADSPFRLTYAGKHSKLGELIGLTVKKAVTRGLEKHMGLTPKSQCSLTARLKRYQLDAETLWQRCGKSDEQARKHFLARMSRLDTQAALVVPISLYVHLMDQVEWGLFSAYEVETSARQLLQQIALVTNSVFRSPQSPLSAESEEKAAIWLSEALSEQLLLIGRCDE